MCGRTDSSIKWGSDLFFTLMIFLYFISCSDNPDKHGNESVRKEYKIAVVLPQKDKMFEIWRDVINWALDNVNASLIQANGIKLTAEWIDEGAKDLEEQFTELVERDDIPVIIGPLKSENANTLAEQCALRGKNKTLIPATTSSEELMRTFSEKGILWCLTENDISQCEALICRAILKGAKNISLLTSNDRYGKTFSDWIGFLANELKVKVTNVEIYEDEATLRSKMRKLLLEDTDCLICIPSGNEHTVAMNEVRLENPDAKSFLLFSDVAFIMEPGSYCEGIEGVAQSPDPESGFNVAYEVRYDRLPGFGVSHYYDAVLLAGLALLDSEITGETDINACLKQVVSGKGDVTDWTREGIERAVKNIANREYPCVRGASGRLKFDPKVFTNVTHSVYCHWQVYNGKHIILEYNGSDDSDRSDANIVNWNRRGELKQDFDKTTSLVYPFRQSAKAMIVATSSKWDNYRHQADAYAMYQLLVRNGFSKEDIILVAENDIASDEENNPERGKIRTSLFGNDVYEGIQVDYQPSKIAFSDLSDILYGVVRGDLPKVLRPNNQENLFVYWVGHGASNGINWLEERIPAERVADVFRGLSGKDGFRKILLVLEACYGGKVGEACEHIPGLLCLTSARAEEVSKSSNYSILHGAWLSNSFSDAFMEQISKNTGASFYTMYLNVYNKTIGSHASIYNAEAFDNLYNSSISEFIIP